MEIEYIPEKEDFIAFNLYQNWQTPEGRKRKEKALISFTASFFFIMLLLYTLIGLAFDNTVLMSLLVGLGLSVVSIIALAFYYNRLLSKTVRDQVSTWFDSGKNRDFSCRHRLVLDEQGLSDTSEYGESHTKWSGMERVEQNGDYIFIYPSSMEAIPLKKKHFPSESAAADFFSFAAEHIEKAQQAA